MQLYKLSPLAAGLLLASLLSACGGGKGDDEAPAPAAAATAPAIKVSGITLNSATPRAIADAALQFDGGACSGGTGALTASWDFGDGTVISGSPAHTYAEAASGTNTVKVTCTDTTGATKVGTLSLNVASAAMNGFLGKTWSTYSRIDPANLSTYPVAGIADLNSGDNIAGIWLRRTAGNMEVADGTTSFSSTSWTVNGVHTTGTDRSAFNDAVSGGSTAAIDQAVSPNGHVIAAWKAGTSIYAVKKSTLNGTWTLIAQFNNPGAGDPFTNEAIKVVVNDHGDGAIAFCTDGTFGTNVGAYVIPYLNNTAGTAKFISNKCATVDKVLNTASTLQSSRAFDIAIDSSSKIYAAGILNATSGAPKSAVVLQTNTAGVWPPAATALADEIVTSPESLSLSLSPNGKYAAIVWNQVHVNPAPLLDKSNVYASLYANSVWGASTPVQSDFITKDYSRPLIAVNDFGVAFLAMRLKDIYGVEKTEVSNYDAGASTPAWSSPFRASEYGFHAADVAIDYWGTGLLTSADSYYTQAGTFAKKTGTNQWSGFTNISPRYPFGASGSTFHYQTMRALPDGRAILVTSVYDDITANNGTTTPVSSGYILLK